MFQKIEKSADYILDRVGIKPRVGIVLGTGLGSFVQQLDKPITIPYAEISDFPVSAVEGHSGNLLFAVVGDVPIVVMQGRVHYYEGYTMEEITFPIRMLKALGIEYLLLSNAAGGMHTDFNIGDMMVIEDHICLMPNPLIGFHDHRFGTRFTDMSEAYNPYLIDLAFTIGEKEGISLKRGCYVGVTGPSYETPAEYRYFSIIGGHAVGMSTVPEVIVARQMDIKCFGISIITDLGIPGNSEKISHEMVQVEAARVAPLLAQLFMGMVLNLPNAG